MSNRSDESGGISLRTDIERMSRKAILNIAMMLFTLASSLGESMHALPGLAHDEASVCHVRTDHMEAPPEQPHADCPVCQSAAPFQAVMAEACDTPRFEVLGYWHAAIAFGFVTDSFEDLTARGPPTACVA